MVQPKYSPEEALNRVKLMMGYDSSKTLNENKNVIFEQNVSANIAADITRRIYQELIGDVESEDLDDVQNILNSEVFGKTYEDGRCLLLKVQEYMLKQLPKFVDVYTSTSLFTGDANKKVMDLASRINSAKEEGEPQFEDIKTNLLKSINSELNGFCKTNKSSTDTVDKNKKKKINW